MNPAKTGFLLLYAAAVAERLRLHTAAVIIDELLAPHLLNLPPTALLRCTAKQQQQKCRRSNSNCRPTQVLQERSGKTRRSVGADCGQTHERRKWTDHTGNRIVCRESIDCRLQIDPLRAQADNNTSGQAVDGSTAANGSYSASCEASHASSNTENSGKSSAASCGSNDILHGKTRSLPSVDGGSHPADVDVTRTDNISAGNYAGRSTADSVTNGRRRRAISRGLVEGRKHLQRAPSVLIPGPYGARSPSSSAAASPAAEAYRLHTSGRNNGRHRATGRRAAVNDDNLTSCPAAKNSTPQTFQLPAVCPLSLSASGALRRQQPLSLAFRPLSFLSVTRPRLCAAAAGSVSQLKKQRRHVPAAAATPHSRAYLRNLQHILVGRRSPVLRATSALETLALANSSLPPVSPARCSSSHVSFASYSSYPSSVSEGTPTCCFLLRSACRYCATAASLTSSSSSPSVSSSSTCARFAASSASSSTGASSLVSASSCSRPRPYYLSASSSVASPSASLSSPSWLPNSTRCPPAVARPVSCFVGASYSRLRPSLLKSLLSPRVHAKALTEQPEELREKVKYIAALVQATPVILFMKGTPTEPACGFSRMTYELLALAASQVNDGNTQRTREDAEASSLTTSPASVSPRCPPFSSNVMLSDPAFFRFVNVLEDDLMREGVKQYSEWPTIPQLYISGQFVGGADITAAMFRDKSLHTALRNARVTVE